MAVAVEDVVVAVEDVAVAVEDVVVAVEDGEAATDVEPATVDAVETGGTDVELAEVEEAPAVVDVDVVATCACPASGNATNNEPTVTAASDATPKRREKENIITTTESQKGPVSRNTRILTHKIGYRAMKNPSP